jgi:PAS domain S-box-containing protein
VHISLLGIFCGAILIFFDSRIEMEQELRVREDLLHTIFNESPDALFLADPETSVISTCNERAMSMFGMNRNDHIIGNNLNYLLKYPHSTGSWNNFKKKFSEKKFMVQELEFKTSGNKYFWGSQAITEITVGNHNYWLVRITDIAERVKDKKTIEENRKILRQVIDMLPHQIFLKDSRGGYILVNKALADLYNTGIDQIIGKTDADFLEKSHADRIYTDDLEVIEKGIEKYIPEEYIKDSNENVRILQVTKIPFFLEDEKKPGLLGIGIDITERVHDKNILEDNERKFRALIENSSDVILILGENFKINYVSPSSQRILGYHPEKLIGKLLFEIIDSQNIDTLSWFLSETISQKGINHVLESLHITNANGDYIYGEVVAVNLLEDPVISGIIINFHDVTKRKITEMELLNANFELDSFVYKASHDLKAPLRSVMGLIKLAKLEMKDNTQQMYLDMMNKSVHSLDAFIKDLTLFSRNNRLEIETKLISFPVIIDEVFNNLMFLENAYKVKINKNIRERSEFYSDITRISTILNNLISNAFKYHRFENNSYINILIEADVDQARIVVEDNGSGIDPLYVDRIFDMFYRASESSYGSGLGLYIVKNAVTKLHGTIEVESVLNQGTKFEVVIPNLKNIQKQ